MKIGHIPGVLVLAAIVGGVGCADKGPATITFLQPELIGNKTPVALRAFAVDRKGVEMIEVPLTYAVEPAGLASVSDGGYVTCLRSGEAKVIIAAPADDKKPPVKVEVPIRCEIVAKIKAPYTWRHVLGREPPPYSAKAVDAVGKPVERPVQVTSSNESVVRVVDGGLEGLEVGAATVVATAAGEAALTEVTVARLILSEPLSIADGDRRLLTLQQGTYEVEIKVAATDGSKHGVALTWVGADCPHVSQKTAHRQKCKVLETATLAIENPSRTGLGAPVDGFLNVLQVP